MTGVHQDLEALSGMTRAALRMRWEEVAAEPAPNVPAWLLRALLASRLQERRYGRLPALVHRDLMRRIDGGPGAVVQPSRRQALSSGTRLIREWNGRTIVVEVLEQGFRHGDRTWRSLSEIARHVTGSHWSGPRFFGLARRG